MASMKQSLGLFVVLFALIISVQCADDHIGLAPGADTQGDSMHFPNTCHHSTECYGKCRFGFGGVCNHNTFSKNTCSCHQCIHDMDCSRGCYFGGKCETHYFSGSTCACR